MLRRHLVPRLHLYIQMGAVGMMILMMTISEIFCLELHENLGGEQPWVLHNDNDDDEDAWIWEFMLLEEFSEDSSFLKSGSILG